MSAVELVDDIEPAEARRLTDRIKVAVGVAWELVIEAHQRRAWTALGHASWDAYCSAEFGHLHLRLPAEDRRETVRSLREAGLSIRAIAAATGEGYGTTQRALARDPNGSPVEEAGCPAPHVAEPGGAGWQPGAAIENDEQLHASWDGPDEQVGRTAPAPEPERRVTGTDGKSYPSATPRPEDKRTQREVDDEASDRRTARAIEAITERWSYLHRLQVNPRRGHVLALLGPSDREALDRIERQIHR